MKKLVFMFAAIVAVSFASCGGNTNNAECADSCATDSCCDTTCVANDSCCGDTTCAAQDSCCGDTAVVAE